MAQPSKILRRSIFTFLQNFHHFTTTPPLLALPFAASVLLLQSIVLRARIRTLFPPSSSFLEREISQNIALSVLAFPSAISSFLLCKAFVIHHLLIQENPESRSFSRIFRIYTPLVHTHICNSFLTLFAKAACLSLMHWAHGSFAAVVSCLILGYTFIISNMALIVAGVEGSGGFAQTLKACDLIKGNEGAALWLTVWANSALAAVEFLFQCRVVQASRDKEGTGILSAALEGIFIAYLYVVLLVVDTILVYFLFTQIVMDQRRLHSHGEMEDQDDHCKSVHYIGSMEFCFPHLTCGNT